MFQTVIQLFHNWTNYFKRIESHQCAPETWIYIDPWNDWHPVSSPWTLLSSIFFFNQKFIYVHFTVVLLYRIRVWKFIDDVVNYFCQIPSHHMFGGEPLSYIDFGFINERSREWYKFLATTSDIVKYWLVLVDRNRLCMRDIFGHFGQNCIVYR